MLLVKQVPSPEPDTVTLCTRARTLSARCQRPKSNRCALKAVQIAALRSAGPAGVMSCGCQIGGFSSIYSTLFNWSTQTIRSKRIQPVNYSRLSSKPDRGFLTCGCDIHFLPYLPESQSSRLPQLSATSIPLKMNLTMSQFRNLSAVLALQVILRDTGLPKNIPDDHAPLRSCLVTPRPASMRIAGGRGSSKSLVRRQHPSLWMAKS